GATGGNSYSQKKQEALTKWRKGGKDIDGY
ncbi:unnamed protein product, partial [marine sediment metagenome]